MPDRAGAVVLVATPIGNLGDLSPRAAAELAAADVVCCEDTRRTGRLFELAGIPRRASFVRVDDHTEAGRAAEIVARAQRGERIVVVTDAGMPGIADPGERIVRAAVRAGVPVEVVPGPSAVVAALVASGLPTGRFAFEGFLPRRGAPRTERLQELADEPRTVVLYEAPHRLAATLGDLVAAFGADRRAAVARELTKLHEEVWRGSLTDLVARAEAGPVAGEVVVVVDGAPAPAAATDDDIAGAVRDALASGMSARDAAAAVAAELGVAKRRAYDAALAARRGSG